MRRSGVGHLNGGREEVIHGPGLVRIIDAGVIKDGLVEEQADAPGVRQDWNPVQLPIQVGSGNGGRIVFFKVVAEALHNIVYRREHAGRRQPEVALNGRNPDHIAHGAAGRQSIDLLEVFRTREVFDDDIGLAGHVLVEDIRPMALRVGLAAAARMRTDGDAVLRECRQAGSEQAARRQTACCLQEVAPANAFIHDNLLK